MSKFINDNTKAYAKYGDRLNAIMEELSQEGGVTRERLAQLAAEFANIQTAAKMAGATGQTFFQRLQMGWQRFGGWALVTKSMMAIVNGFKRLLSEIKEIDTAMTELRKVTDLTTVGYQRFYQEAVKASQQIGATVSDTINAAADFARLGYSVRDSLELGNAALIYRNVGDGIESVAQASESLISTIRAFGDEAYSAMDIVDQFNEVGNNFAISSTGIGDALTRSAAALAGAGNTLEESIGLITAANSVVQNPESVGTSMKTLTMYLRAAKTELDEAGESSEGCANSVSELRSQLKMLTGVDIMKDANTFKSTFQIIKELSEVWGNLTDTTRANVTQLIGGKRNANVIQALITNFEYAQKAMETASNAAGSALAENEKYLDSIAGKLDLIRGKIQSIAQGVIGSTIVKGTLDILNGILSVGDALQRVDLLLPAIASGIAAIVGTGLVRDVSKITASIIGSISVQGANIATIAKEAATAAAGLSASQRALLVTQLQNIAATDAQNGANLNTIASAIGLTNAQGGLAAANTGVAASFKAIWTAIPVFGKIALGVTVAITAFSWLNKLFGESKEKIIELSNTIRDDFSEATRQFESQGKSLQNLRTRYEELSRGVDEDGRNVSLTTAEYEEFKSIVDQIIQISPTIVKGYDEKKNAILNYKTAIDDATEALGNMYDAELRSYLGKGESVRQGLVNTMSDAYEKLSKEAYGIFDVFEGDAKYNVLEEALSELEIISEDRIQEIHDQFIKYGAFTGKEMVSIVQNWDKIRTYMISALDENGNQMFSDDSIVEVDNLINSLYDQVKKIVSSEQEWVSDVMRPWVEMQDWFKEQGDAGWLGAFLSNIGSAINMEDSYTDQQVSLIGLFNTLKDIFAFDGDETIAEYVEMAESFADGTTSIEDFNSALNVLDFYLSQTYDSNIAAIVASYILDIANASTSASSGVEDMAVSIEGFSKALERLRNGYSILEKVKSDMEDSGGLSMDTVKAVRDALDENERLTDYLYAENGVIKLNTEAWEARSKAIANNDIIALGNKIAEYQSIVDTEGQNIYSTEEIEEAKQQIKDLTAQIELYKAVLEQPTETTDPLNLTAMLENIGKVESASDGLIKALEGIKNGSLQDWNELVQKYPELMKFEGLFDINTLEGQEEVLRKVISSYDEQIDKFITDQIELIKNARAAAAANGESLEVYDTLLINLNNLRSLKLTDTIDSAGAINAFDGISNAMDKASTYAGIVKDSLEGIDFDLIEKLRDTFGEDWEKYTLKDDGKIIGIDFDTLQGIIDAELEMYGASQDVKDAFHAMWEEAKQGKEVQSQYERMTDAMSKASKAMSVVKELRENGVSSDFAEGLRDIFGEEGSDKYITMMRLASFNTDLFIEALRNYVNNLYTAAGATETETAIMKKEWVKNTEPAIGSIKDITSAISEYESATQLMNDLNFGKTWDVDLIDRLLSFAETSKIDLSELLVMDKGKLKVKASTYNKYVRNLLSWDNLKLKNIPGLTLEIAKALQDEAVAAIDAQQAVDALNDTLGNLDTVQSIISGIESGDTDFVSTLKAVQEIALSSGKSVEDFFDIVNGKAYWDETAILKWGLRYIDEMVKLNQLTPETAKHIKELSIAQAKQAVSAGKLNNVVNTVKDTLGAINDVSVDGRLTYDKYKTLLDISQDYASAVQYNNGMLTLNKKKYDEITSSLVENAKAEALARRDVILASEEYKRLSNTKNALGDKERERLRNLDAEIMSYTALAVELENATMAYQKFLHADDSVSGEQYTAAEKAAKVINDTLYNKESELYGRKGRHQFKEAVSFLISPDIKINTKEFKDAWDRVKRYMKEDGQGLQNFIDDLYSNGIIEQGSHYLNSSLDDIADKLNISKDLVRSMIEEWNTYGADITVEPEVDQAKTTEAKDALSTFEDRVDSAKTKVEDLNTTEVDIKTEKANENVQTVIDGLDGVKEKIGSINDEPMTVKTTPAESALGRVKSALSNIIKWMNRIRNNNIIDIAVRQTTYRSTVDVGAVSRNGYSMATGTRFADGAPGGRTLVGEQGREIVVDPETNRWYTVGDRGAEFRNIPKGALVFNAQQTKDLLTVGHISTRAGNSLLSGTAAANNKVNKIGGGGRSTGSKVAKKKATQKYVYLYRRASGSFVIVTGSLAFVSTTWPNQNGGCVFLGDFTSGGTKAAQRKIKQIQKSEKAAAKKTAKSSKSVSGKTSGKVVTKIPKGTSSSSGSSGSGGGYSGGGGGVSTPEPEKTDPLDELLQKYKDIDDQLDHLIQHQLYLYDVSNRALNYDGMAASLSEQAKIYQKQMDNAQKGINDLMSKGATDSDKRLQELEEVYWGAHRNLYATFDKINALYVDGLNEKIDSMQKAYGSLTDAANQFNDTGSISMDQFQALLDNGIQFLDYMDKVNGKYVVNKDAVDKMIKSEREQLAIESALGYLNRIKEAADTGGINKIRELANETQQISHDSWTYVNQMLTQLASSGKIPDDLMKSIRANVDKLKDITGQVVLDAETASKLSEDILDKLQDQEKALDKLVDLTQEMIKSETNDHIQAIEKEVDLFKEIIDLKKESLDKTREEDSYQKDVNDKLKEIANLRTRIDMLSMDDSRSAQAERASLIEQLSELQQELADTQSEHSYQAQIESLDKMATDYEESRQQEIDQLEESISSAEKLYQLAIERIRTGWDTLYQDLIVWNTESGSVLTSEITDNWQKARAAAEEYGDYVTALQKVHAQLAEHDKSNDTLRYRVEDLPKYHGGGIVNNAGSINSTEALAVLKKGEVVLDQNEQKALFRLIDLKNFLSEKLGSAIKDMAAPARNLIDTITGDRYTPALAGVTNNSIDFRPDISVTIAHSGSMNDTDATRYGNAIADLTLNKLYEAFESRGAGNIFSGKFKG